MVQRPEHLLSTAERPLKMRSRADLQVVPVAFAGQTTYVVKDPLTLEITQLTEEEHFLFRTLAAPTSLGHLQREFERRFAPRTISHETLQQGLNRLFTEGLLISTAPGQGEELQRRGGERRRHERFQSLLNLLSIRVASFDATKLLDSLHGKAHWVFTPAVLLVAVCILFYAGWILLGHSTAVLARMPTVSELLAPRYWLMWLLTIVGVKVLHELAHGITCKQMGGRCHEMGVLLLALVPCLYCDVTDIWRLPSKWQRIAVSAAGMVLELFLAASALILWWHTEPGLFNTWLLSVAVVCSVGTLLINANPLLRYDGYYILSDWLEIPNLSGRSQGKLTAAVRNWLLAEVPPADRLLSPRQQHVTRIYAVAAKVYLVFLFTAIFAALYAIARPYRLENLVTTLLVVTLAGMLFPLLATVWRTVENPATRYRLRRARFALFTATSTALVAALFLWPVGRSVTGPAVFVPADGETVYATVAGELQSAVPPDSEVRQGDVLAVLADSEAEFSLASYLGEEAVKRLQVQQLRTMRAFDSRASLQLPTAEAAWADASSQLAEHTRRTEKLVVRAPKDGTVITPPLVEPTDTPTGNLPVWHGSPLEERNLGSWIEPGTVLCTIGNPHHLEALVEIDQRDIAEISPGDEVKILLSSSPIRILTGKVVQIASRGNTSPDRSRINANAKTHLVQVQLKSQDDMPMVGSYGTAKITAGKRTVAERLANYWRRLLRVGW